MWTRTSTAPRAYLVTLVTRLCLNELDSARSRREESRADRLPEPVAIDDGGIGRVDMLDRISMAFLVLLQRLTPAERAVLLLRDVFDFDYKEIASLVGKNRARVPQAARARARARRGREAIVRRVTGSASAAADGVHGSRPRRRRRKGSSICWPRTR